MDFPTGLAFPFVWTLPLSRRTLLFDDLKSATDDRRTEAFNLISDAARRADNIGMDEIPTLEYFNWLLLFVEDAIALYDDFTNLDCGYGGAKMVGLVVIFMGRYVRSRHPSSCSMILVTGESISTRLVWRDLTRLVFDMVTKVRQSYTGCLVDVFVTCFERVAALRDEGFVVTACVPSAGLVSGFPGRHVDSYVMYKESNEPAKPLYLTFNHEPSDGDKDVIPDDVNLLVVPYLPVRRVLADGTAIIVRSLRDREEIKSFYAATKAAANSGKGYGVDELPDIGFFVQWYVNDYYNIVFELAPPTSSSPPHREHATGNDDNAPETPGSEGRIIAYANIGKSYFSRSVNNAKISDSNIVILPEFRGRRWSEELLLIRSGISYDMGFTIACGDTVMNNLPLLMNNRVGVVLVGTIPRAAYLKDVGWIDTVLGYLAMNESFEKKLPRRAKRPPWQVESKL